MRITPSQGAGRILTPRSRIDACASRPVRSIRSIPPRDGVCGSSFRQRPSRRSTRKGGPNPHNVTIRPGRRATSNQIGAIAPISLHVAAASGRCVTKSGLPGTQPPPRKPNPGQTNPQGPPAEGREAWRKPARPPRPAWRQPARPPRPAWRQPGAPTRARQAPAEAGPATPAPAQRPLTLARSAA